MTGDVKTDFCSAFASGTEYGNLMGSYIISQDTIIVFRKQAEIRLLSQNLKYNPSPTEHIVREPSTVKYFQL